MDLQPIGEWMSGVPAALADTQTAFLLNHAYSFWFGLAAFLIFCFVLMKFGFGPILRAIDARDQRIAQQLKESEETAAKARELQAQLQRSLDGAEAKIAEMISEARRDGEALKAKIVEEGRAEVQGMRGKALRDIDAARHQALVDLRGQVAEISASVAEKILRSEIDEARHRRLVEEALEALTSKVGEG